MTTIRLFRLRLPRWTAVVVAGLLPASCVFDVEGTGETGTDGATDSDPNAGAASSTTTPSEATGGETSGAVAGGEPVDCATLAAGGPTVAGVLGPEPDFAATYCVPALEGEGTASAYACCSDDPSAPMGALPDFEGRSIDGATAPPFFAGANNDLGRSGLCVRTSDIPTGSGLLESAARNCPIPCDPSWPGTDIEDVCGPSRVCCQTRELQPEDCVLEEGVWQPVPRPEGFNPVFELSDWEAWDHPTHQDPDGSGCVDLANGVDASLIDCLQARSVAHRRGYCMRLGAGQHCPQERPGYIDTCEAINLGLLPPP